VGKKASPKMSNAMYDPLLDIIEYFQKKGATTRDKALTLAELGVPEQVEQLIPPVLPKAFPIVRIGDRYYLSEERLRKFRERGGFIRPIEKWIQHTAKVPKGFLRFQVLHKLNEQPMSGAELTSAIETELDGHWKPKPGSMYPLLKTLLHEGLTREIPDDDGRTRRYELTSQGKRFLDNQVDQSGELREKIAQGFSPLHAPFLSMLSSHPEISSSLRNLFNAIQDLRKIIGSNPPGEILKEFAQAADRFVRELRRIREEIEDDIDAS
jgi:DNA-binding PadR family transcriptional regulator